MFSLVGLVVVVVVSGVVLLFTTASNASVTAAIERQPNIVIIMADDMGIDDVSFRGQNEFLTPNIDALGFHGKVLDRLYAPALCTPSRSALLTGRYPIHTGMQHFVISNEEPWGLPTNITTMAEIFQSAGYSTNLIGKWHLGYAKREFTPTHRGFDYHYGYWGAYIDYYQRRAKMPLDNYTMGYDFRRNMDVECGERGTYVTDLLTKEAERVIYNNSNTQPLFLMLSHLAGHTGNADEPLQAPVDELNKFQHIKDPDRRKYAAMISRLDQSVGRIVAALDATHMLENSIVIFYSDNGAPSVGTFANSGSNWPLRGQKSTPWEGGVRVPGVIWSPRLTHRGTIYRQPFYVGDWLPTLSAAAGLTLDTKLHFDGINLWPQMIDTHPQGPPIVEREILHTMDEIWHVASYMNGQWKYINGTTSNGAYDNVLTLREFNEIDPRNLRYTIELRNSLVSRAIHKYDENRLSKRKIERLRREASIKCGTQQHGCNPLIEECLFNLDRDPCERNNLIYDRAYQTVIDDMHMQLKRFRESAIAPRNRAGILDYDPSRHQCLWTNFLDEHPTKEMLHCDYASPPCNS